VERKLQYVCVMNSIKQYNLKGCSVGMIFMKYIAVMASDGTIYIPNFMKTDSSIQIILTLLPQKLERLQC
jgi:hypothetical protein